MKRVDVRDLAIAAVLAACSGCGNGAPSGGAVPPLDRDLATIAGPSLPDLLRPVERVPRAEFGAVGPHPLTAGDVHAFIYPSADDAERASLMEGLTFFTTVHTAAEGLGPVNNQTYCLGCHKNAEEAAPGMGLFDKSSQVARAARATPTNFAVTSYDPTTGGGRPADDLDAVNGAGHTAAFTLFGDFSPATNKFDGLTQLNGFVQHTRPSLPACLAAPIPAVADDPNLKGGVDPVTYLSASGWRRTVGERAAPPYIGRGLIEAIFSDDIVANEDPGDHLGHASSLQSSAPFPECPGDCISGHHNQNTSNQALVGGEAVSRVGRFGLRAAGPTILQFVVGGINGELGFTTEFNPHKPADPINANRPQCQSPTTGIEIEASRVLSCRQLIRLTAPPEFGDTMLGLLRSPDPAAPRDLTTPEGKIQRGAALFGVDLVAFANRMIAGRMPAGGDGRDAHAINQSDRALNCVGCHTPVHATGKSPAAVGSRHLSYVWAPIFSDILLHEGPEVTPERLASLPRNPVPVNRAGLTTFDIARNLADDALPNQGVANGREFRTPPLMGLGRVGPPFLHDGRIYLSALSMATTPASTVYSDSTVTNAPLVVRTFDDAIHAVIELHDLPPPDDARTPQGGGCPLPAGGKVGDLVYAGPDDICPQYDSAVSKNIRGEARQVIRRFRSLLPADQQAVIEFLKQL
jgi:CxxC motif-containing protein (DUF1111 family)